MANKEIIIEYRGKYGFKKVMTGWSFLQLPGTRISAYIRGAENNKDIDYLKFIPSGKNVTKDGKTYELWEEEN